MTYEDAVIYLEVFVKQAEDLELNSERFREKVEPYRLSLLRHAADNVTSQRMVTYVFHRLINYVQTGDYAAAQEWFTRSLKLCDDNDIARNYLAICQSKLAAKAAGKLLTPAGY